jgi:hypothetical protein
MSHYWAEFKRIDRHIFRFDTRVYLEDISIPKSGDICIGALVGKNPGSAKASKIGKQGLQPILLDGDKLLPTLRNVVKKAHEHKGKQPNPRSYIQVLNLFYLCNPVLSEAIKTINNCRNFMLCSSESKFFPWVWYVWGGESEKLSKYKMRFRHVNTNHNFFYDKNSGSVKNKVPSIDDFAKHTQGLKHDYVVPYIAKLL